jgi:hypothetical protein
MLAAVGFDVVVLGSGRTAARACCMPPSPMAAQSQQSVRSNGSAVSTASTAHRRGWSPGVSTPPADPRQNFSALPNGVVRGEGRAPCSERGHGGPGR